MLLFVLINLTDKDRFYELGIWSINIYLDGVSILSDNFILDNNEISTYHSYDLRI